MRSSKKPLVIILGAVVFFILIWAFDLMLYPCTYLRNDVHKIASADTDVIILGTSNGKMGIDPDILLEGTGYTGHNLAAGSEYPVDSYFLAKLAMEKNDLKRIIFEVDPGYFTTEKEKGNNYLLFYHEFPLSASKLEYAAAILPDADFRSLLFPFYEYPLKTTVPRIGDTLSKKLSNDFSIDSLKNSRQAYHENGYIERFPVDEADFSTYHAEEFSESLVRAENRSWLEKLIALCRERGIELIAISTPLPQKTLEENNESFSAAWDYFSELFAQNQVAYFNFNREYYDAFPHEAKNFVDYDGHLNSESAAEFSRVFRRQLEQ